MDFVTNEVDAPLSSWVLPLQGIWPFDKAKEVAAVEAVKKACAALDAVLQGRTFLVGDAVTLADVTLVCVLSSGMKAVFDAPFRAAYPSLTRHYTTLANQPPVAKVLGPMVLCDKALSGAPAPAAAKPAAAAAAKPAPAAKPAKKKEEEEDDDGEPPAEKPVKNPLDDLPKSKMVLDSWKRLYSNTPAAQFPTTCCQGLWAGADIPASPTNEHFEGFDAEGFSLWYIEHKYPEEQTVAFKALNATSGFFQRCDYARKHAFAVMSILHDKEKNIYPIRGFWIFRGQEVNWQMVKECDDLEVYTLTKQDTNDPEVRKRVAALLCEEATIDGLENFEAKVFK